MNRAIDEKRMVVLWGSFIGDALAPEVIYEEAIRQGRLNALRRILPVQKQQFAPLSACCKSRSPCPSTP